MAPLRQPFTLYELASTAINRFTIWYAHWGLEKRNLQFEKLKTLFHGTIPPTISQTLLPSLMKMAATEYTLTARAIKFLLQLYIHPRCTELVLSDLAYMKDVSLDDLDVVEECLEEILPNLTNLTYIDLSTNLNKCTWPSCSTKMLDIIGENCSKLTILNLNNNNRVTGESISYICPTDKRTGCPLIEKLYIQDTSLTPNDVHYLISKLPNLTLLGYKEIGSALSILHKRMKRKKKFHLLNLTHFENTESRLIRTDGKILPLLNHYAPNIVNLKVRIDDDDFVHLQKFRKLRQLEIRCFNVRGYHDTLGNEGLSFISSHGKYLFSLTMFSTTMFNSQVGVIAESCCLLERLILYSNDWESNQQLLSKNNKLNKLQFLSVRIGDNELVHSPEAASLITFLIEPCQNLEEIYLLIRSTSINHQYFMSLFQLNPLSNVKIFLCDAPRRTLSVPMIDLTEDTAYFLIENCLSLQVLGNLISWNIEECQVENLKRFVMDNNYNVNLVRTVASRINTKYFYT